MVYNPVIEDIITLSLHDALPIFDFLRSGKTSTKDLLSRSVIMPRAFPNRYNSSIPIIVGVAIWTVRDRKSTRLNSSHPSISYAVFCLKKKKNIIIIKLLFNYYT